MKKIIGNRGRLSGQELEHHPELKELDRREFLKDIALFGAFALLSTSAACKQAAELPSQLPAPGPVADLPPPQGADMPVTKVSLVRTPDRTKGVPKAIALLQPNPVQGKAVVLKPNFNTADPAPGSTHNDTLRALVLKLKEMGATKITLAERCGPMISTREVMQQKGTFDLARELGFDIINLEEMEPDGWVLIKPGDSHWKEGFLFPRVYREAESIVQTCCLKTHAYGGHFTLSLKNAVGMVAGKGHPYMTQLHTSLNIRQMIAEISTAYSPDLIVLDGVDAFVKGGPDKGTRVQANVILAGSDRVAIDAVGVAILRSLGTTNEVSHGRIFEQDQITRAVELGLGVRSPAQIELVTDDPESAAFA
ncbi:MAG: DUF362 domain-containing protein, partial [Chloroflexi bacterium]|nr:DUF362 domain-containing protein [Chloroflexota bacterium]